MILQIYDSSSVTMQKEENADPSVLAAILARARSGANYHGQKWTS